MTSAATLSRSSALQAAQRVDLNKNIGTELRGIKLLSLNDDEIAEVKQLLAERAWTVAGGTGATPDTLVAAMLIVVSSFTTHSMIYDRKRSLESLVRASVAVLLAVIGTALAEQLCGTEAPG